MSTSFVYHVAKLVSDLKPGFAITVSREELKTVMPMRMAGPFGPEWNAVDQIMEKIVGSAYSISVWDDPRTGNVTFHRLRQPLEDGRRTFVSPDRREHFTRDFGGTYLPSGG